MKPFLILVCTTLLPAHEIRLTFQQPDWYEQLTEIYDKYPDNTPYTEASIEWGSSTHGRPRPKLPAKIKCLVDVDSFLTALALDNLTVNLDSYVGVAQNYWPRPADPSPPSAGTRKSTRSAIARSARGYSMRSSSLPTSPNG